MSKEQAEKIASEFILRHRGSFATGKSKVTKKQINAAIKNMAREIKTLSARSVSA